MTVNGRREFFALTGKKLAANVPALFIGPDLDVNIKFVVAQDELRSRIRAISANSEFIGTGFQ